MSQGGAAGAGAGARAGVGGGGGELLPKKCHVLFEWPVEWAVCKDKCRHGLKNYG